ncbi:MAG: hypothetical protein HFJ50_02010 [Clostridia bacterium]|jgi:hypothetical protein|nr:hypothetical protein [Clostridia bacterium]
MTTLEIMKRRIKIAQEVKQGQLEQFIITKTEAKELGNIKEIDGVTLVIASELSKTDCFGYINNAGHESCYGLNKLECVNCHFYRNDVTKADIEKDVKQYEKYGSMKGVSLR